MEHASERFDPAANARAVEGVYGELLGIRRESSPAPSRDGAAAPLERVAS
jgi:hypothetical protein